jgi:signal transduction histidine kinase
MSPPSVRTDVCLLPYRDLVIAHARGLPGGGTVRQAALAASHALAQVAYGPDRAPVAQPRWRRLAAGVLAALGAAMMALVIAGLILALHRHGLPRQHGPPPAGSFHTQSPEVLLAVPAQLAPLLLAPRSPLLAWRLGYLAVLLSPLVPGQSLVNPPQVAALLIVFSVAGLRYPRLVLWGMEALMLIPAWLWIGPGWAKPLTATLTLTAGTAALDIAGAWRRALAAEKMRAEHEQARRAVLEERARIARDLHDIVAHHLSLMAIQAGSAPYRLAGLPGHAEEEFASLSRAARAALADMRRLLGVLRSGQPAERMPQPRLADLPELAAAARRAGVAVDLSMPGDCDRIPPGVGICAYRIVQEALSNAGRHAPGTAVTITVSQEYGHLSLRVANGPPPAQLPVPGNQSGHGLAGMRERVALLGGILAAGSAADGGFAVSATLPLHEPAV